MRINRLFCGCLSLSCLSSPLYAALIEDSKASLYMKNLYFDRDIKDQHQLPTRPDLDHWSQSFTLNLNSGYTDTPVQVGLDATARYAIRLSSGKNIVDNVMPYDSKHQQQARDHLKLGAALKLKYQKTELKIGELVPKLPIIHTDAVMQLPTTFLGALLESTDIQNTKITAGRITKVSGRNEEDYAKLRLINGSTQAPSDGMNFLGVDYDFKDQQLRYFYAQLEDIYDQHFLGYEYRHRFNQLTQLKSNLYFFDTRDSGQRLEGKIDSQAFASMNTLSYGPQSFGLGYKHMQGDTQFPLLAGWVPQVYLANWSVGTYSAQDQRSWQLRYDYDFKNTAFKGLKTTLRYYYGDNIKTLDAHEGVEKELDVILNYEFQHARLKGLALNWLYADYKHSLARDYVENRVAATYSYNF
ncbi:outer membrane OprD family porin [Acinetobacter calcoaceticus]|uniref:Outer membrane OprD family porin n=1 Tax=Acinetobacter calcoaceticus TaxID=471 RepID=A0A4R1XU79_ACICA|nr:outer membrane OprD family porin [Acinetobacter calcoaceticus]